MPDRKRIPAGFWWRSLGDTFDKVCREFITRARAAEQAEKGHECGHRFEVTVRSSLHVSGPGEHTDADWWSADDRPVVVRAHNLRDALLIAATLPLSDWFQSERVIVSLGADECVLNRDLVCQRPDHRHGQAEGSDGRH
jgi:hypothetical protein